ncbi:MAG: EamA family transporter [Acetobacteraceae bacterium]
MTETWIPLTVAAALLQTWRTALQQRLRGALTADGAAFVRFLYGAPAAAVLLALWCGATGQSPPPANAGFLLLAAAGGVAQILGTSALIRAFSHRSFAVGTAYAKTEAVQGAILAWILLGETISPLAWAGIAIGAGGVLVLSLPRQRSGPFVLLRSVAQPAALCGLAAGAGFSLAAILFKSANLALDGPDPILRALLTLLAATLMQTLMMAVWLARAEPATLRLAFATWRSSARVGVLSALGSACWFSAFALAPVALVRALGQVEMLFTLAFSRLYLGERVRREDVGGFLLVVLGVLLVLAGR